MAHASGPSSGCGAAAAVEPGSTDLRLTSGGVERSYLLIVPDDYDGTTPYPIVLGLHALTVDYRIVPALSGFADMAATYDFVGVAPSGLLGPGGAPYWNATAAAENEDLAFLSDLLDHLERTLCVDTGRVFSIGMSNGAQTSSLLACRLPRASRPSGRSPASSSTSRATARRSRSWRSTGSRIRSCRTKAGG